MVIDLSSRLRHPLSRQLYKAAAPFVERGLHIRGFNDLYENTREAYLRHPAHPTPHAWFNSALQLLGVRCDTSLPAGFQMPSGPLIVVANHPFGLLDPVLLGDFLSRHRSDLRIMTNFLLDDLHEMRPWIIPVDPFHGETSTKRNLRPMKDCLQHLKQGGMLAVFPGGEVAHYEPGKGLVESPWSNHVAALARRSGATVLPVYFDGRNSVLFHTAGVLHPRLRTGLLLRELFDRSKHLMHMRVGKPIAPTRISHFGDDVSLTSYLRLSTLILGQQKTPAPRPLVPASAPSLKLPQFNISFPLGSGSKSHTPSPFPQNPNAISAEVRALAPHRLVQQGKLSVYVATAPQIPNLLREIGRCREITFRQVGEGTGQAIDLDRFDRDYLHLFLWDDEKQVLAGAYRVGRCDQLLRQHGSRGLYTSTLFKFQQSFLDGLHQAVELGRSFITSDYQRNPAALPLLWRGICTWVARHPQYHRLFGPVSISQDYHQLSRKLMVEFLGDQHRDPFLASLIKPRQPFQKACNKKILREFISADLRDVDDFSAVIANLEPDGKGIPVLLKHYLRFNGTLLSFNVDKSFANCLDGLIHVDLLHTNPKLLAKYMGSSPCAEYLAHHQSQSRISSVTVDSHTPFGAPSH